MLNAVPMMDAVPMDAVETVMEMAVCVFAMLGSLLFYERKKIKAQPERPKTKAAKAGR